MNYKRLFGKLERNLDQIERSGDTLSTLYAIVERLVDDFHDDLGLVSCRIYVREEDSFILKREYPDRPDHIGLRIPTSYAPLRQLVQQGFVIYDPSDPEVDREIEDTLGVRTFAAVCVDDVMIQVKGTPAQLWVLAFSLEDTSDRQHVTYALNTVRHVINLKLRKEYLENRVSQARSVQLSLLPKSAPEFHDYDVWGRTITAEEVGGDLYDYIPVSERSLGIAIADSAGHGLPAALQARDAIVGLRMGIEERWRITASIEKLNKVVGRSGLVSRFISLFYCEVEPNGNLVYCNAGHNPPLLFREGEFTELTRGGLILGPNPAASYERGYQHFASGSILLAYTDGISEAQDDDDEMFGTERLKELVAGHSWTGARELVDAVFAAVRRFSDASPPLDDQTVVAVLRR